MTIKDVSGNPVKGANVSVVKNDGSGTVLQSFLSDGSGIVFIPGSLFETGNFLRIDAPGYYEYVQGAEYASNGTTLYLDKKNNPGPWLIGLAAAAAYVVVRASKKGKKKIAGLSFPKNPLIQNTLLVGGLGLGAYLLLKGKDDKQQLAKGAETRLQQLRLMGIYPKISSVQAENFSSALVNAFDNCGTDEDAVFHVFDSLSNEADLMVLINTFGVRSYDGCFEGSIFTGWSVNLAEAITAELSTSDVEEVNNLLLSKGINYKF